MTAPTEVRNLVHERVRQLNRAMELTKDAAESYAKASAERETLQAWLTADFNDDKQGGAR